MRKVKKDIVYNSKIVNSKFGQISIGEMNKISFPLGILGMPQYNNFHLTPCPIEKFNRFLLMQSGDDMNLIFMVLPIDNKNPDYLDVKDLDFAYEQTGIPKDNASVILIASTKILDNGQKVITVNARAPIIIDHIKKSAIQYVMQNSDYEVQKIL